MSKQTPSSIDLCNQSGLFFIEEPPRSSSSESQRARLQSPPLHAERAVATVSSECWLVISINIACLAEWAHQWKWRWKHRRVIKGDFEELHKSVLQDAEIYEALGAAGAPGVFGGFMEPAGAPRNKEKLSVFLIIVSFVIQTHVASVCSRRRLWVLETSLCQKVTVIKGEGTVQNCHWKVWTVNL